MTLEAQKIKFSNMEIYNSGNNLIFDATGLVTLNSSGGGEVDMLNKIVNINDKTIIGCVGAESTSGTDLAVKGLGTGDIIFKCPNTQVTPIMRVQDNGVALLNQIPTCSSAGNTTNQIIRYNNFDTPISFTPTLADNSTTGGSFSSRSGSYYRIGNLVWFRASMTIIGTAPLTLIDDVRIGIPIAINYTGGFSMPQALTITNLNNITSTNTDVVITIGGTGATSPGATVQYAKLYYKPNNSTDMTAVRFNNILAPITFEYSGVYYVF